MENFNCRGKERRRLLVREYKIEPVAHLKLINGQKKRSAAEDTITDQYYIFSYSSLKTGEKGTFICGTHVAKDFLFLLGKKPLPLFNPLHEDISQFNSKPHSPQSLSSSIQHEKWDPLAKECYNAIHLIIMAWNLSPDGAIWDILKDILKYYDREPFFFKIKSINTIVSNDFNHRTLTEINDEFIKAEPRFIKYDFTLMKKALLQENIKSYL